MSCAEPLSRERSSDRRSEGERGVVPLASQPLGVIRIRDVSEQEKSRESSRNLLPPRLWGVFCVLQKMKPLRWDLASADLIIPPLWTPPLDRLRSRVILAARESRTSEIAGSGGDLAPHDQEPPPPPADDELIRLLDDHTDSVYRLAVSLVRDPALAEDVVQETLIKAWRALPSFRGDSTLRRWVLTIAHHTSVSLLRATREEAHDPDELPDAPTPHSVEKEVQDKLAVEKLWEALGDLDDDSRALIVLRDIEGLSYEELSEMLGLPLSTIRTRLFRARRRLASTLEEWRP